LTLWLDYEVENLQRDDTDQGRAIIGELCDLDCAITSLNGKTHGRVNSKGRHSVRRPSLPGSKLLEPKLLDKPFRQRETCRSRVDHRVVHFKLTYLILADLSFKNSLDIVKVLDLGRNDDFSQGLGLHVTLLPDYGT
jgi:hypothetical protein